MAPDSIAFIYLTSARALFRASLVSGLAGRIIFGCSGAVYGMLIKGTFRPVIEAEELL